MKRSNSKKHYRDESEWGHHSEYGDTKRYKSANKKKRRKNQRFEYFENSSKYEVSDFEMGDEFE